MASAQPQPTRTYDFTGGSNAVADQVDTDLNTLYTVLQGGVGNTHVADDASIAQSKIATSTLGYAESTSDQTDFSAGADITGLSTTVTVPSGGRRVRIRAQINLFSNTADTTAKITIQESSTVLNTAYFNLSVGNVAMTFYFDHVFVPSSGSHTYKLRGERQAGSGTLLMDNGTGIISSIHVELV